MSLRSANRGAAVVAGDRPRRLPRRCRRCRRRAAKPRRRLMRSPDQDASARDAGAGRWRLAAHLHDAEPGTRRRVRAADRELGEPEAHGGVRGVVLSGQEAQRRPAKAGARHHQARGRDERLARRAPGQLRPTCASPSRIFRPSPRSSSATSSRRSRKRFRRPIRSSRSIACWRSSTRAPSCRRTCPGSRPIRR